MHISLRIAFFMLAFLATAGCASSDADSAGGDASPGNAVIPQGDAPTEADSSSCGVSSSSKPVCLLGGPCSCSDIGSDNRDPVCVDGGWRCPPGYTRFEDCRGVPPGPSCRDAASTPDGDGGAQDVVSEHLEASPDVADGDERSLDGPASACNGIEASKPTCLLGGPCSCSDIGSDNRDAICVDGGWRCPPGYTRFEDCRGVPPSSELCDGGVPRD